MPLSLSAEKALIFRITHRANVPWILDHGLHCRSSDVVDPNFVTIGNPDVIDKRHEYPVPCPPGGTLSDYVPFYFTPCSPMLYNIVTGWRGLKQRNRDEIAMLVSSLHEVAKRNIPFIFTDRHALLAMTQFHSDLANLSEIDWPRLQSRDFRHDPEEPEKVDRYQAEALVYGSLPAAGLLGIVCYNQVVAGAINEQIAQRGMTLRTAIRPEWFM